MEKEKQRKLDLGQIVNSAVEEGIDAIIERYPRFADQEELLAHYIDKKKINGYVKGVIKELKTYRDEKKATKFLNEFYNELAGYVAAGEVFSEEGKEVILRESWEKRARRWFTGGAAREVLRGERYLDKVMASFRDLYHLFKTRDYAQRMPELAEAVATVYDMGFADAAVNVLYEKGLMNERRYKFLKNVIAERVKEGAEYTQKKLQDYIVPQKAAAVIFGILGLGVILASNKITGAFIGTSGTNIFTLALGGLLLIIGILLWCWKRG